MIKITSYINIDNGIPKDIIQDLFPSFIAEKETAEGRPIEQEQIKVLSVEVLEGKSTVYNIKWEKQSK